MSDAVASLAPGLRQAACGRASQRHTGISPAGQPIENVPSAHSARQLAPRREADAAEVATSAPAAAYPGAFGLPAHCEPPGPDWQA
jgi:hypothetical protein